MQFARRHSLCKMPSASLRSPMAILASWTSLVWLPIPPIVRASYVPLEDGDLPRAKRCAESSIVSQIMVGSRDPADIEAALEKFFAVLPQPYTNPHN